MIETTTEEPTMQTTITFTPAEIAKLALPYDLASEPQHFQEFVREMLDTWTCEQHANHIRAMIRRNDIHNDPACLDTAYISARVLRLTDEEAGLRYV
jgi:hypothetical protein